MSHAHSSQLEMTLSRFPGQSSQLEMSQSGFISDLSTSLSSAWWLGCGCRCGCGCGCGCGCAFLFISVSARGSQRKTALAAELPVPVCVGGRVWRARARGRVRLRGCVVVCPCAVCDPSPEHWRVWFWSEVSGGVKKCDSQGMTMKSTHNHGKPKSPSTGNCNSSLPVDLLRVMKPSVVRG